MPYAQPMLPMYQAAQQPVSVAWGVPVGTFSYSNPAPVAWAQQAPHQDPQIHGADWACGSCTFVNPATKLCCDICAGKRQTTTTEPGAPLAVIPQAAPPLTMAMPVSNQPVPVPHAPVQAPTPIEACSLEAQMTWTMEFDSRGKTLYRNVALGLLQSKNPFHDEAIGVTDAPESVCHFDFTAIDDLTETSILNSAFSSHLSAVRAELANAHWASLAQGGLVLAPRGQPVQKEMQGAFIELDDLKLTRGFTLAFSLRMGSSDDQQYLWGMQNGWANLVRLSVGRQVDFAVAHPGWDQRKELRCGQLVPGQAHQIVATYAPSGLMVVYVDGQEVGRDQALATCTRVSAHRCTHADGCTQMKTYAHIYTNVTQM